MGHRNGLTPRKVAVVTGCAGLLGANFVRHLLSRGWDVVGVDNLSGGYRNSLPVSGRFKFVRLDLNSYSRFLRLCNRVKPSTIYHFAAYAAEGLSPFIRRHNYKENLLASASVINAGIETGAKIVFASSMAVYGRQDPPFSEKLAPAPIDPYGIAKAAVEADLAVAAEHQGLRYSIVRPHNVIGPFQNIWDRYRNVLGIFIRRGLEGQALQVFGDGKQKRAFSDVAFYMKPLERLSESGDGEIYNLGSDEAVEVQFAAEVVAQSLGLRGHSVEIEHVAARHEVKNAFCSHEKAKRELEFADGTELQASVDAMIDWAVSERRHRVKSIKYEVQKGIYSYWR